MEKQLASGKTGKDKVTEDEVIAMYEKAGDLAMYHLQVRWISSRNLLFHELW